MHPEYKQQITNTRLLKSWVKLKGILDEQGRYAVSQYSGLNNQLIVYCNHCGQTESMRAKPIMEGSRCGNCKRASVISKVKQVLKKQDRIWLNEDEFSSLYHSKVHALCNICGHASIQMSGNIFRSNNGCPKCFSEKMPEIRKRAVRAKFERGKEKFKRALSEQNREMVGTYKKQAVKVSVKCNLCNDVSDILPATVINNGTGCQACKPNKETQQERLRKPIGINMSVEMADAIKKQASSMHLSTSKYCKVILAQWLESGEKLKLQER